MVMDGKSLKKFVEDDQLWAKFIDERFAKLDKSHTGKLTHSDLEPAIAGIGNALGLPPMGTSPETDHIYTEMFSEFGPGGEGVTKERFSTVMRDILLGLGDGLEREPVAFASLDGSNLERWARSAEFEIEAVAAFGALDADMSGQVKAEAIKRAMRRVSVDQGMPPQTDIAVSKFIDTALEEAGVNVEQELDQLQFVDVYRKVVLALAKFLKDKPLTAAHTEKVFDGSSIRQLIKDKQALDQALDLAWEIMPKTSNGSAPKSYLRVGLDTLAPYAGLPPVGAVPEIDTVVNEAFRMIDDDVKGRVDKPGFEKCMLEVLGGVMLQLEGKPIGVASSAVVPPEKKRRGESFRSSVPKVTTAFEHEKTSQVKCPFHTNAVRRPPSGPNPEGNHNFEVNAAQTSQGLHTNAVRRPPSGPNPEGNFEVNAATQDTGKRGSQNMERVGATDAVTKN